VGLRKGSRAGGSHQQRFPAGKGEFIAWLNSDDLYARGAVRKAVSALQADPQLGMVFSNVFSIDAENEIFNTMRYGEYSLSDLMAFNIIGQPGVFMRRSVLESAGYMDLNYHYLLDHQLWLRIASKRPSAMWTIITRRRASTRCQECGHGAGIRARVFRHRGLDARQPDLQPLFRRDRRKILAGAYRLSARYLLDGGSNARALGHYLKSLWYHPVQPGVRSAVWPMQPPA
jgi:hypothetical protein